MYTIQTLNKIAAAGTKRFDTAAYTVTDTAENPDAIMVRSAAMHDMTFGGNLLAIARAGAGTNNIPVDRCAEAGICVFNTPGANANAVKELVLTGLLLSSRKLTWFFLHMFFQADKRNIFLNFFFNYFFFYFF